MDMIPRELSIGGVFLPPMLIAAIAGVFLAAITARLLNRFRISRFVMAPSLIFLAMAIIYTGLISTFIFPA